MPNLIVILFNLLYPVFYVVFLCKCCVCERVWRLKAKWRAKKFSPVVRKKPSCEVKHVLSTWLECKESWQMVTASFCEQFVISDTPGLYIHYIYPHYPYIERSVFQRENPNYNSWELEIVIPIILYIIHCDFLQLIPLHFQILERLIA